MYNISLKTKFKIFLYRWTAIDLFTDEYEQFCRTPDVEFFKAKYNFKTVSDDDEPESGFHGMKKAIWEMDLGACRAPDIEYYLSNNPLMRLYGYFKCNLKMFIQDIKNGFKISENK